MTASRFALMSALAGLCAQALQRARLHEREREAALALQRALAPDLLPDVAGYQLAGRHVAAGQGAVGGDFYDVVRCPSGRAVLAVGDVEGHGLPATAVMAEVRTTLRVHACEGRLPAQALARANQALLDQAPSSLTTCCVLVLDTTTGEVQLAVAGHLPPVVIPAQGEAHLLDAPANLPLGCLPDQAFQERQFVLAPGDTLLLYSDGLVESRACSLDDGLATLLTQVHRGELTALVEDLVRDVRPPDSDDDLVVLALRRDGAE